MKMLKVEKVLTLIALPCAFISSMLAFLASDNQAGIAWGTAAVWCFSSFVNLSKLIEKENER